MGPETNLEREFKFDVDPGFEAPDLGLVVGHVEDLALQHLTTTYFDTSDLRLWDQGITLRYRSEAEGGAAPTEIGKWTLKLPVEGESDPDRTARSELTWKAAGDRVPTDAAAVVAGLVRRAVLAPVVVLSTDRRRLRLYGNDGAWAEIDDDLVTVSSGTRQGLRFRQIELEMLGDGPQDVPLEPVLRALRQAGAEAGGTSKFALAAGLDSSPSDEPTDVGRLLHSDYRIRVPDTGGDRDGPEPEVVQQALIAVRRLQSGLQGSDIHPELEWFASVLARTLSHSERHLGATELFDALRSESYEDLLERLATDERYRGQPAQQLAAAPAENRPKAEPA